MDSKLQALVVTDTFPTLIGARDIHKTCEVWALRSSRPVPETAAMMALWH